MLIEGMMGGIELAKYEGIDFTPPEGAREAAKRALDVREGKPASQRGMTPVGIDQTAFDEQGRAGIFSPRASEQLLCQSLQTGVDGSPRKGPSS